jgi:chloramphenicol 3-O phosphotransferase
MSNANQPGQIVILNGAPRSGKSSIVAAIQETFDGPWINLGVDIARQMTPASLQPGIGFRPERDRSTTRHRTCLSSTPPSTTPLPHTAGSG